MATGLSISGSGRSQQNHPQRSPNAHGRCPQPREFHANITARVAGVIPPHLRRGRIHYLRVEPEDAVIRASTT